VIYINGSGFTGATDIKVGGVSCSSFNVASATSATCTTPAGTTGTASVEVTTGGGTSAANTLFTYTLAPQATLVVVPTPGSMNVNGTSTLSTTGGSGSGVVSYSLVSGPCTLSGATLTGTGAGSCSVTATKAADSAYDSATSLQVTVAVSLAPQAALVVTSNPTSINVNDTSTLGTTGGS
jgi:trimeric autotransporter adhesin